MKAALVALLLPFARLLHSLARWQRLWAFCQLQAKLPQRLLPSVVVLGCPDVHGSAAISLGAGLLLYRHIHLETQQNGSIEIGDGVVISRGVHIVAHEAVRIGKGSMIGEFSSIRDANHQFGGALLQHNLRDAGHRARAIHIGEQVWIGRGVTVLPGVQIGDYAVIGANAVVSHDVAAGTVVAGVPARPLSQQATGSTLERATSCTQFS